MDTKRIIKFRAWVKDKRFGHEMFDVVMISFPVSGEIILSGKGGSVGANDCELMQFTGLKDRNGKEIYEGDNLKIYHVVVGSYPNNDEDSRFGDIVVKDVRIDPILGITAESELDGGRIGLIYAYAPQMKNSGTDIEVIGNIYENSELLKNN